MSVRRKELAEEHYFSPKPLGRKREMKIPVHARGILLELGSASGVFSKSRLDPGSALLIESAKIRPWWRVLDLGCGFGAVGILLARAFPSAEFLLSDINERAVALSRENIQRQRLQNADARVSDGFDTIPEEFDAILLNPPQTAGKQVCIRLLRESFAHLRKGGLLQVVARHKKGGQSLSKVMQEIFGNAATIARKSGYHVYVSEKNSED